MPAGDRTGPMGMGPRTGRAMGYCAGFSMPGNANPAFGRGLGQRFGQGFGGGGFGGGRGYRNRYFATGQPGWARGGRFLPAEMPQQNATANYSREQEIQVLKSQSEALQSEMTELRARLAELEGSSRE